MPDTKKRILITEDEKPLAYALTLKLKFAGFDVVGAADGKECLDLINSQDFDVVLLDLIMPEIDGFQVLEAIKDKPHRPVIFVLSNLSQHSDEERVLQLGASKFFIKSDTPLTTIVDEVKKVVP